MQDIDLDLDKENELVFKLSVEGTKPATMKSRFLIEMGGFSLFFPAKSTAKGEVSVSIPPLENMISEGNYSASLEVIIDDKVFTPMSVNTEFKKSISVIAEVVTGKPKGANVSVSPVVSVNSVDMNLSEAQDKEKTDNSRMLASTEAKSKTSLHEDVSQDQDEVKNKSNRKRPNQRSGKRPDRSRMSSEAFSRRLLEKHVRNLASKKSTNLTDDQVLKVVKFLSKRGIK